MTPTTWKTYNPKLYAANWFSLFDSQSDERGRLAWASRFTRKDGGQTDASTVVYNFYSSTEDVLAEYSGELPLNIAGVADVAGFHGSFGWVFQEKGKGDRHSYGEGLTHLGSLYGGWGFNLTDPANSDDPVYYFLDGASGRHSLDPSQITNRAFLTK